jgi:hypothetical protein
LPEADQFLPERLGIRMLRDPIPDARKLLPKCLHVGLLHNPITEFAEA